MTCVWVAASVIALTAHAAAAAPTAPSPAAPAVAAPVAAPAPLTPRRLAVGYRRGTGLGWLGLGARLAVTPRLTPSLSVFGQADASDRGLAIVPALRLSLRDGYRAGPYVEGGLQYLRLWFGDAAGGGLGGYGSVGWELRHRSGLGLELGVGLHGKPAIHATDGNVSVEQPATFGVHWDAGLHYWF